MRIKSASGVDLPMISDKAYCEVSGISPAKMKRCPLMNFDDRGAFCVPELCESYRIAEAKREEGAHAKES